MRKSQSAGHDLPPARQGAPPAVRTCLVLLGLALGTVRIASAHAPPDMDRARKRMVQEVLIEGGITNRRVVRAMLATPRHEFVPRNQRNKAYYDMALPIGQQQTITSPFTVAYMTQCLDPEPTDVVLEIGTGSGYQAAVLSPLVREVFTIEIVASLGRRATRTLRRLGYKNVHVRVADGYAGWPDHAPFDKIIVTCSPENVPPALARQLREGGRMVIPVGQRYQQTMLLLRKKDGKLKTEALRPTLFVPMTGRAESERTVLPDPEHPQLENPGFEQPVPEGGHIPGWYYQRQLEVVADRMAPEGEQYVVFENRVRGRSAHALQGFGIDGRTIGSLDISAWVATEDALPGPESDMLPMIAVTFYDEDRRELGHRWLGPWRDTRPWERISGQITVPAAAREAILRIGLFGAVGRLSIDGIAMHRRVR